MADQNKSTRLLSALVARMRCGGSGAAAAITSKLAPESSAATGRSEPSSRASPEGCSHGGGSGRSPIGAALVLLAAVAFSAKAVLIKLAYRYPVDAATLLSLRMAMSLPFFLAAAAWAGRDTTVPALGRRDWLEVLALGLLGYYLASLLDFLGLQYVSAGLERLILFLYPTLVLVLSALFLGRRIRRRELAALALSYGGILLAVHGAADWAGARVPLGAALVFASALAYALYLIGSGRTIRRVGPLRFTAYAMTVACAAVLLHFAVTHPWSALVLPREVYGLGLAMALVSTVLPSFLMAEGIRRIGAEQAALLGAVGPVATIFLGYLTLGEHLMPAQATGAGLVIAGVLLVTWRRA
ncbi:MAG: DMT family transporter [Pseudomonadota bacterium]